MLPFKDIRDPLASLVAQLSNEIKVCFNLFGDKCRDYASVSAESPDFARMLAVQAASSTRLGSTELK